jgi:Protein of unknown function (DUF4241)
VNRLTGLDPRLTMAIAGGVMGVLLVVALFAFRPIGSRGLTSAVDPTISIPPLPYDPMGPDELAQAYEKLGRVTVGGRQARLSVTRADDLILPSGRVVAADAFILDARPFTVALPPGHHPVLLLQADGQVVAAAMVRVEGARPVQWVAARVSEASGSEPSAYPVDSGTGSFASAEAVARFGSLPQAIADALIDRLIADYSAAAAGGYPQTAAMTVDPGSGANVVTFTSGYGDGVYASWFGLDAQGNAVALLTSFDLIESSR